MASIWKTLQANKAEIIEAYRNGENTVELGRRHGCSNAYVWRLLKQEGELRQTQVVEPNMAKIVGLHLRGKSAYAITAELGLPRHAAERALKKAGYDISSRQKKREDPLVAHKEEIVARYLAWEGTHLLGKAFGCSDGSINRQLRRWGVKTRTVRETAYSVDEGFFDRIDTEAKAYTLGFWMADGCNMQHVPDVCISITDADVLLLMARAMKWEGPVSVLQPRGKGKLCQYRMSIGSRRLSDALARLGCVSRKTWVATFPNDDQVPPEFHRHLVRGWMDGDGTITRNSRRNHWHMAIVGTEAACRGLSACVFRHLGFSGSVHVVHEGDKHTTWGFTLCVHDQLKAFLTWLYADSTIYLGRKKAKQEEFFSPSGRPG